MGYDRILLNNRNLLSSFIFNKKMKELNIISSNKLMNLVSFIEKNPVLFNEVINLYLIEINQKNAIIIDFDKINQKNAKELINQISQNVTDLLLYNNVYIYVNNNYLPYILLEIESITQNEEISMVEKIKLYNKTLNVANGEVCSLHNVNNEYTNRAIIKVEVEYKNLTSTVHLEICEVEKIQLDIKEKIVNFSKKINTELKKVNKQFRVKYSIKNIYTLHIRIDRLFNFDFVNKNKDAYMNDLDTYCV